jgi:hypothetical protein
MHLPFNIAEPCNEDWSAMQPNGQGRHCMSCAKTVVDFTGWEVQDISNYVRQQTGAKVCGRFKNSQLAPEPEKPREIVVQEIWTSRLPEIKKMAAMICLFFSMFFTACDNDKPKTLTGILILPHRHSDTTNIAPGKAVQDSVSGTLQGGMVFNPIKHRKAKKEDVGIPTTEVTMGVPPMPPEPIQRPIKPKPKKPGNFIGPKPPEREIMGGLPADVQELPAPVTGPGVDTAVKR